MASERPLIDFSNNTQGFIEYIGKQQKSVEGLITRVKNTRVDYKTTKEEMARLEDAIYNAKGLVEYELLVVSKRFTEFLHQIRNKLCSILEEQYTIIQENQKNLLSRISTQSTLGNYNLAQFNPDNLQKKISQAHDGELHNFMSDTISDLLVIKNKVHAVQREQSTNLKLIKKLENTSTKLTARVQKTISSLSRGLEESLSNLLPQLKFKDLQNYNNIQVKSVHLGVNAKNTFEGPSSVLHFFEPGTPNLHYIDVARTNDAGMLKWSHALVNTPVSFPVYHSSVITPSGRCFITGGLDASNLDNVLSSTYAYDFQSNSVTQKANMVIPRHGHSTCHVKGKIYAIGGLNKEGQAIVKCEVYDIAADKWSLIADLPSAASQPTLVKFGNRFIYKIGGYVAKNKGSTSIERYSIAENRWTTILNSFEGEGIVQPLSGAIQINPSQIFVFGGQGTNASYVINVDEAGEGSNKSLIEYVGSLGEKDLPVADGFWDSQAAIYKNEVFYLQNITNKEGTLSGQRNLIVYDGIRWESL